MHLRKYARTHTYSHTCLDENVSIFAILLDWIRTLFDSPTRKKRLKTRKKKSEHNVTSQLCIKSGWERKIALNLIVQYVCAASNHTIICYSQQCLFYMGNLVHNIELRCTTLERKSINGKICFVFSKKKLPNTIFALFGIFLKPLSDSWRNKRNSIFLPEKKTANFSQKIAFVSAAAIVVVIYSTINKNVDFHLLPFCASVEWCIPNSHIMYII